MQKVFIVFVTIIFSQSIFAYIPTLDSLLRNGNNIDIGKNTVQANLRVVEIDPSNNQVVKSSEGLIERYGLKLLLINENENKPKLTQVNYKGGVFNSDALVNLYYNNVDDYRLFSENNENVDGEVFYSVLLMLLNNDSKHLIRTLKKHVDGIKANSELINEDKFKHLLDYKNYLVATKELKDTEEAEEIENPMRPKDEDKVAEVKELKKTNFLKRDELVKRIKVEDDFSWVVDEKNLYIKFTDDHRITEMRLKTGMGELEFTFGKFKVYGAKMEFPEFIWFRDLTGKKYLIKPERVTMFSDTLQLHSKRLKRYQEHADTNKIVAPPQKPSFIL